ncbi:exosome component 5 Rrp46 [Gracilaria domingensis]|nr:exosome component 5 Rrp46 [Gracilaria domingensis]
MDIDNPPFQGQGTGVDAMLGMKTETNAGRRDGRAQGEMRAMTVSHGEFSRADGSARIRLGGTDVIVAIYGPMDCPHNKQQVEALHVHVAYRRRERLGTSLGAADSIVSNESVLTRDLQATVTDVVLAALHPRKAVVVAVQVLSDNGGVVASAINATTMALLDAGLPMRALPLAASVSIHNNALIVDPVLVEEREAHAVITITNDTALEKDDGFMSVYTLRDCGGEEIFATAVAVCRQLVVKTRAFLRLSLEQKAALRQIWNAS